MKLALLSTPRSGNTWLRSILSCLYGLEGYAVHTPDGLSWTALPDNCIVQLHWRKQPTFERLLARTGFQVVAIARHPIAVLLSVWHFAPHEPETAKWLGGEGGDESSIFHRPLSSPEFLRYACGPRAKALLSVTPAWWNEPGIVRVRYEDLVREPHGTLSLLHGVLGAPKASIDETIREHAIDKLRTRSTNNHFWRGEPELWRQMIPPAAAREIERAHADVFRALAYDVGN